MMNCFLQILVTLSFTVAIITVWISYFLIHEEVYSESIIQLYPKSSNNGHNFIHSKKGLLGKSSEPSFPVCQDVKNVYKQCRLSREIILINEANGILYCAIPKVASTTVKLALVRASNKMSRGYHVHNLNAMHKAGFISLRDFFKKYKHEAVLKIENLQKVIVVRHPLERLLSAYLDKFKQKNKWTKYFQDKFGKYIISNYRLNKTSPEEDVTFKEFVQFLTDERTHCSKRMNPHWAPYWILCRLCKIKYTRVVYLENFSSDFTRLWLDIFGTKINNSLFPWEHKGLYETGKLLDLYTSTLSSSQIKKLYKMYQLDFRIFGYK